MATIEPHLMHLLNDNKAAHPQPLDLPPIQGFSFASQGHSLSLPPLNLDAGQRGDNSGNKPPHAPKHMPSLYSLTGEDSTSRQAPLKESAYNEDGSARLKKSSLSLRLLLDDQDSSESSHSLRLILDDTADTADDPSTKKRHRALTNKEELIHLPQPLKKQKSSQQVVPRQQVPPIINGLQNPPPNPSTVFPPISSAEFDDKQLGTVLHEMPGSLAATEADKGGAGRVKRRAAKPRKKWSEEETNHLLLGVSRHGVGKWTCILDDPDFMFNGRTAGDLKDRFRTCCPDELRGKLGQNKPLPLDKPAPAPANDTGKKIRGKASLMLENILIDLEEPDRDKPSLSSQQELDNTPRARKSRAHRKKMEDLVELGIRGPFKKSHRRERRPFTEQDDKEILDGLEQYGPAWTKIQRDPRFHLSSRQPTDLRDRVRNKYPDIYARMEKGSSDTKELGRILEPSVNTTMENSLASSNPGPLDPALHRSSSKEDIPRWQLPSSLLETADSHTFDLNEPSATALLGSVGEMDISRLLLDDSQLNTDP